MGTRAGAEGWERKGATLPPAAEDDVLPPTPSRRGRLAPADCYPAGDDRVTAHFVRIATGERVRVVTAGDPGGPPVVLVHGWACSVYSWRNQLPALAAAGYRVIAADLRGHGLSDKPVTGSGYSTPSMADFLALVLDVLDLERVALVGHSLGAAIAARMAMRQPARASRLAVVSGVGFGRAPLVRMFGGLPEGLVNALLPLATSRALFRTVLRLVAGGPGRYSSRDVDEYWAMTQFPDFVPALWQLIRDHDWTTFRESERESLRLPLLTMFGGRDRLVRDALALGTGSMGGQSETRLLTGVGHAGQEEAPALVNALLLPFLEPWRKEFATDARPTDTPGR